MAFGILGDVTDLSMSITDLARAVENADLESLFLPQHTHIPGSRRDVLDLENHENDHRLLDPFVALGAAAAVTSRLKLGTCACLVAQYDPIMLAKQVASLDQISQGRFLFGIAPGWIEEEMMNHGLDPLLRWKVLREKSLAMKKIWTDDEAEFHGRFVDFNPILLGPKPVQQPHPPILVAGAAPHVFRRVVEYGDEWMPVVTATLDLESQIEELHRHCREAGRSIAGVTACLWDVDEALIERCADLGVGRCVLWTIPKGASTLQPFLERCSRVAANYRS